MKIINILWSLLYYTMNILRNYVSDVNFANKNIINYPKLPPIPQYFTLIQCMIFDCRHDLKRYI